MKYLYKGEYYSDKELAKLAGVSIETFNQRINKYGWSIEDAISGVNNGITISKAKRDKKRMKQSKLKMFAQCNYRCNAK